MIYNCSLQFRNLWCRGLMLALVLCVVLEAEYGGDDGQIGVLIPLCDVLASTHRIYVIQKCKHRGKKLEFWFLMINQDFRFVFAS